MRMAYLLEFGGHRCTGPQWPETAASQSHSECTHPSACAYSCIALCVCVSCGVCVCV